MGKHFRASVGTRSREGCARSLSLPAPFLPQLAEVIDVFWAPLSALLVFQLYGSTLLSGVALVEELLPFTDIFPTATVGWILQNTVSQGWGRDEGSGGGEEVCPAASVSCKTSISISFKPLPCTCALQVCPTSRQYVSRMQSVGEKLGMKIPEKPLKPNPRFRQE
jgi:hypothetical protein